MGRKYILMSDEEPTDEELAALMREVAIEAREKALVSKKQLRERIAQEIKEAQARYEAKNINHSKK